MTTSKWCAGIPLTFDQQKRWWIKDTRVVWVQDITNLDLKDLAYPRKMAKILSVINVLLHTNLPIGQ